MPSNHHTHDIQHLIDFRDAVDEFMATHPQSPLDRLQQNNFQGLSYFDYNPDLVFEVEVERLPDTEPLITMQTSTGDQVEYRRWGRFNFEVDDQPASLTIYSDAHSDEFFLPFRDATGEDDSYAAGRYLDSYRPGLQQLDDARFAVDFNYAYNPYCAYSELYSCPLPPIENWLKVPIRAGEKRYQ